MIRSRSATLVAVVIALTFVISAVPGGASPAFGPSAAASNAPISADAVGHASSLDAALRDAVGDAMTGDPAITGSAAGWAFGAVNQVRDDSEAGSRPLLFIARQTGETWEAALQSSDAFAQFAALAPGELLDDEQRTTFAATVTALAPSLALPFATGETWELDGGPHRTEVASNRPWSGIDFAGGSGKVRASAPGTVIIPSCANQVIIDHGNNWQTVYYHLSSIAVRNGQTVARGAQLGVIGTGSGCGGSASGAHVHFEILSRNDEINLAGQVVGGWTIVEGEIPYNGCLVKEALRRCAGGGDIYNDGTVGLGTSQNPTATPTIKSSNAYCPSETESALLTQLNAYRDDQNRDAIPMSRALGAAAERHAEDVASEGQLSLTLSDGTHWQQNPIDYGYTFQPSAVLLRSGTNLTATGALTAWKSSDNAKLLQTDPYDLSLGAGVGHAVDGSGKHYWVLYIGRYLDAAPACGAPDPTPTKTATATAAKPALAFDKEKSKYNGWVVATLTGFAPNSTVTLNWPRRYEATSGPYDGQLTTFLASGTANGSGALSLRFRTPLEPVGDYTVKATGASNKSATAILRVIPRIMLNEDSGPKSTTLRVYFYGFGPGENIDVRWHSNDNTSSSYTTIKTVTVASNGRASTLVPIPSNAATGAHRIVGKVVGVSRSASTTFTLTGVSAAAVDEGTPSATATAGRTMPTTTPSAEPTTEPTEPVETPVIETPIPTETPEPTLSPTETAAPTETPVPTEAAPEDEPAEPEA